MISESNVDDIKLCFHGGEPLIAGLDFYKMALPAIKKHLGSSVNISLQSNLWNLTDDFCKLFLKYQVQVGTSLDGPEKINDRQRGSGYFKKTRAGIDLLHKHGLSTGCIATFTSYSASQVKEVYDFFLKYSLSFSVHSAVKPVHYKGDKKLFLSAQEYETLLIDLLDLYIPTADKIRISTVDTMVKNISRDESGLCTFSQCLGDYLAIAPDGSLYPCNRFSGEKPFSFGSVDTVYSLSDIKKSKGWKKLTEWQDRIDRECSDCIYKNICHGGCPYAGFSSHQQKFLKDPLCKAYQGVYKHILDRGTEEFFSHTNLKQVGDDKRSPHKSSFFRNTPLLRIMDDSPHPYELARASKEILAAALFGVTDDLEEVIDTFLSLDLTTSRLRALYPLKKLYQRLHRPSFNPNNLYLHITDTCNLFCNHCYARAQNSKDAVHFPLNKVAEVVKQAKETGFRKIVITGGEPLLYPELNELLKKLIEMRKFSKLPTIVLRTNLTQDIRKETPGLIEKAFDEIVVSIDGTEEYHNNRRGKGSYKKTISNLALFSKDTLRKKVSITSVFGSDDSDSISFEKEKKSVYQVKETFQLHQVRFRSLLPLGRARSLNLHRIPVEKISIEKWVQDKYITRSNCGLGQVLMINPDGNVYPCHVYADQDHLIGNVFEQSIFDLVKRKKCTDLRTIGVDSDKTCRSCQLRYLCGGPCRVWSNEHCTDLYERALSLLLDALDILKVPKEKILEYGIKI